MPKFHVVPTTEVPQRERAGREEAVRAEYVGYIDQIGRTKAGKLTPSDGETTQALRRRLGAAAKHTGKELIVKRNSQDIYFWRKPTRRRKA